MTKYLLILNFLLLSSAAFSQDIGCGGSKYSSLVVDEKSGKILYEKRSDDNAYPASLVKLMTLYLTFEALENHKLEFNKELTVSVRGEEIAKVNNGNSLHLKEGDKITVKEAILSVIVKSYNEAAVTLAEAVSGSEWEFVRNMNEKADKLGMTNSSFRNASGLHEEGQYTNGYDLARLAISIKRDFPQYYPLFATKNFSFRNQKYATHNHVLMQYKGAEGMKTGFTNASGFNLISAAKQNNARLISIVLGCPTHKSRDKYTKQILDICFKKLETEEFNLPGVMKLNSGFNYRKYDDEEDEKEQLNDNPKAQEPLNSIPKQDLPQNVEEVEAVTEFEIITLEPQEKIEILKKNPVQKKIIKKKSKPAKKKYTLKKPH